MVAVWIVHVGWIGPEVACIRSRKGKVQHLQSYMIHDTVTVADYFSRWS